MAVIFESKVVQDRSGSNGPSNRSVTKKEGPLNLISLVIPFSI